MEGYWWPVGTSSDGRLILRWSWRMIGKIEFSVADLTTEALLLMAAEEQRKAHGPDSLIAKEIDKMIEDLRAGEV